MSTTRKPCGNPECHVSTGICDAATFGSGDLDDFGYWEFPCPTCARAWEEDYPGDWAWPRKRVKYFDGNVYFAENLYWQVIDGTVVSTFLRPNARPIRNR